jgi:hypothetical protein
MCKNEAVERHVEGMIGMKFQFSEKLGGAFVMVFVNMCQLLENDNKIILLVMFCVLGLFRSVRNFNTNIL